MFPYRDDNATRGKSSVRTVAGGLGMISAFDKRGAPDKLQFLVSV